MEQHLSSHLINSTSIHKIKLLIQKINNYVRNKIIVLQNGTIVFCKFKKISKNIPIWSYCITSFFIFEIILFNLKILNVMTVLIKLNASSISSNFAMTLLMRRLKYVLIKNYILCHLLTRR